MLGSSLSLDHRHPPILPHDTSYSRLLPILIPLPIPAPIAVLVPISVLVLIPVPIPIPVLILIAVHLLVYKYFCHNIFHMYTFF
jgi:hypothetical protein